MIPQLLNAIARLCAALLLMVPLKARAEGTANPVGKVAYQGFLTDENGVPLGNSSPVNQAVIFRIFSAATGGTPKWAEQQTVTMDKGHFSVLLGGGSPNNSEPHTADLTSIFAGGDASERLIEITLGETRILPRVQFFPVPYSMLAMNARQFLDENGNTILKNVAGKVNITGGVGVSGEVTAQKYSGAGGGLTGLNASTLATGTVPDVRLSPNVLGGIAIAREFQNLGEVNYTTLNVTERVNAGSIQSPILTAQRVGIGTTNIGSTLEVFETVSMLKRRQYLWSSRVQNSWLNDPNQHLIGYTPTSDGVVTMTVENSGNSSESYDMWIKVDGVRMAALSLNSIGWKQAKSITVPVPKGSTWLATANGYVTDATIAFYWTELGK